MRIIKGIIKGLTSLQETLLNLFPSDMEREMDRLSELPEEILLDIMSRLSFQEATTTGILSTHWRRLQTRVFSLNFYFTFKPLNFFTGDYHEQNALREVEFLVYVSKVNHAMDSYNGDMHVSNAFRVDMPSLLGDNFDKWIEFALSRKVEIIDLRIDSYTYVTVNHYVIADLIPRMCKHSLLGVKRLCLSLIYLDDQDIELILTNFAFLEHLSIYSPGVLAGKRLENPKVVGHCKLSHLNISNIVSIQSIEIRDVINLVSVKLYDLDSKCVLSLDSLPNLIHFEINDGHTHKKLPDILPKISCVRHQLRYLKLSIFPNYIRSTRFTFPKFINLKHMELNVRMEERYGTRQLYPLIVACPSLEKLEIKFLWSITAKYIRKKLQHCRIKRKKSNFIYKLKKVRLSGYFGSVSELELTMYLMNNVVALQELVIEACDITPEIRQSAIARTSRCLQSVPQNSVSLVIM